MDGSQAGTDRSSGQHSAFSFSRLLLQLFTKYPTFPGPAVPSNPPRSRGSSGRGCCRCRCSNGPASGAPRLHLRLGPPRRTPLASSTRRSKSSRRRAPESFCGSRTWRLVRSSPARAPHVRQAGRRKEGQGDSSGKTLAAGFSRHDCCGKTVAARLSRQGRHTSGLVVLGTKGLRGGGARSEWYTST